MKTFNKMEIKYETNLAKKISQYCFKQVGKRMLSCYILGSIAHGGYIRNVSDIDIAIIFKELYHNDNQLIDKIIEYIHTSRWKLSKRVSIFWGSLESINDKTAGRFYIFDVIDLVENGILIFGKDVRKGLNIPLNDQLKHAVIKYFLDVFFNPKNLYEVINPEKYLSKYFKKKYFRYLFTRILFPLRCIYTLKTCKIAANHTALEQYIKESTESYSSLLVQLIFFCRENNTIPSLSKRNLGLFKKGMTSIYLQLFDLCIITLNSSNDLEALIKLKCYQSILKKNI